MTTLASLIPHVQSLITLIKEIKDPEVAKQFALQLRDISKAYDDAQVEIHNQLLVEAIAQVQTDPKVKNGELKQQLAEKLAAGGQLPGCDSEQAVLMENLQMEREIAQLKEDAHIKQKQLQHELAELRKNEEHLPTPDPARLLMENPIDGSVSIPPQQMPPQQMVPQQMPPQQMVYTTVDPQYSAVPVGRTPSYTVPTYTPQPVVQGAFPPQHVPMTTAPVVTGTPIIRTPSMGGYGAPAVAYVQRPGVGVVQRGGVGVPMAPYYA